MCYFPPGTILSKNNKSSNHILRTNTCSWRQALITFNLKEKINLSPHPLVCTILVLIVQYLILFTHVTFPHKYFQLSLGTQKVIASYVRGEFWETKIQGRTQHSSRPHRLLRNLQHCRRHCLLLYINNVIKKIAWVQGMMTLYERY